MSGAGRQLQLKCRDCGRVLTQAEDAVARRVREGKPPRCPFCATELPLPDELVTQLDPPSVREPMRRLGKCPGCLRPAKASGPESLVKGWCNGCALAFRCDAAGHGSFDLPATPQAQRGEVEQAAARFSAMPLGALVSRALRVRLERGALSPGEPARLAHMAEGLATWRSATDVPLVPWVADEVRHLLAPFIFGAPYATRDERGLYRLQLSMLIGGPVAGMDPGTKLALSALGMGLLAATGVGFGVAGGGAPPAERLTRDYWVRLTDSSRGCTLDVATAQNGGPPHELPDAERSALATRLFELKPALQRYVRAVALCGPALRGPSACRLTEEAARARLVDIGVPVPEATRAAQSFVVGPPTA